jgi:CheY-like chemotaxis protein
MSTPSGHQLQVAGNEADLRLIAPADPGRAPCLRNAPARFRGGVSEWRCPLSAPNSREGRGAIVLLVEDSLLNRTVVEDVFEFDGIPAQLVTADTAEDAIRLACALRPALILMDIRLPGMNGLEATQQLRSDHRTRQIPIWALTAHAMNGDAEQAVAAGCDRYLAKPIDVKDFRARIKALLLEDPESVI